MAKKQMTKSEKKQPLKKEKVGRFQITLWNSKRLLTSGDPDDVAYIEHWVDVETVCIQYSQRISGTDNWKNQKIFCKPGELRDLSAVLDQM